MKRCKIAILAAAIIGSTLVGTISAQAANEAVDAVTAKLKADGYRIEEVERTWLGRYKIEARKDGVEHEMIVNQFTGDILRDRIDDDRYEEPYEDRENDEYKDRDSDRHDDRRYEGYEDGDKDHDNT